MRDYIMVTEELIRSCGGFERPPVVVEEQMESRVAIPAMLLEELNDVVFKLRAFTESSDGEFATGVEYGMQRAADMIENVLHRHQGDEGG